MALILLCQKELRRNDIINQLTFPTHALAAFDLPPGVHEADFLAFDADDVPWRFHLTTRSGKHPKPVIRKSTWNPFVVNKQLREDDRVMFFTQETDDGLRFHVRARRKCINIFRDGDGDEEVYVDVELLNNHKPIFSVRW